MSRQVVLREETVGPPKSTRVSMMRRIHVEFPKLRPDLRHSPDELRIARLQFCEEALGLKQPLKSMGRLNEKQLGRVIEAIKDRKRMPELVAGFTPRAFAEVRGRASESGCGPSEMQSEVIHFAGPEQVWAIEQVFAYLRWSPDYQEGFLQKRYKRSTPKMLSPKDANACLMILFNIAASRDIKAERGESFKVSRKLIGRYIPVLKKKLGIDQRGPQ